MKLICRTRHDRKLAGLDAHTKIFIFNELSKNCKLNNCHIQTTMFLGMIEYQPQAGRHKISPFVMMLFMNSIVLLILHSLKCGTKPATPQINYDLKLRTDSNLVFCTKQQTSLHCIFNQHPSVSTQ